MPRSVAAAALALLGAGCAAGSYSRSADRAAAEILAGRGKALDAARAASMVYPRPEEPGGAERDPRGTERDPPVPVPAVMTLREALRIATLANRDYRGRTEGLTLTALSLSGARFEFSPRLKATMSYLAAQQSGDRRGDSAKADASLSQVLPTGGTLTVTGGESGAEVRAPGGDFLSTSSVGATLHQPLLRGAGYEASHESLTQAERDVVYALRDYARFREEFLIDVTRRYYGVLSQRTQLKNTEENYTSTEFQTARTQALFQIGTQDKLEVLRAENELLRARLSVVIAKDELQLAEDRFKEFLGLPTTVKFDFADETPAFLPVDVALDSAVEAALANRFDLANSREQLEDAERGLRNSRRNLLPDLALEASWRGNSPAERGFLHDPRDAQGTSVGLFLDLPIQQTLERNAFRAAEIAVDRQRRAHEQFRDDLVLDVRDSLRRLRQAAVSLDIQARIIAVEEKRLEKARLDFEAGRIGNRDVLEAQTSLLNARNDRVLRTVDYEIARISLERAMGTIALDPDGGWHELRAAAAGPPSKEKP